MAQAPDLHGEPRFVQLGDVEDLVEQEAAVGPEGLDDVPAVTRAEGAPALEEDVVPPVPDPVAERYALGAHHSRAACQRWIG